MKILIDNGLNKNGTGIAAYSDYLATALANLPDTEVSLENFTPRGGKIRRRLAYLHYLKSKAYRKKVGGFDVVHYTNYAMPKRLPAGVVSAVTVHDLTAFSHPDTLSRAYAAYNRKMVRRAVRSANIIFTVSAAMAEEIAARFPATKEKIMTVYPGHYEVATPNVLPEVYENEALQGLEKGKFFLFIGTLEARKNLTELVNAYALLLARCPAAKAYALVLAGRHGRGAAALIDTVLDAPDEADIRLPGYVCDSDRAKLLAEATALVFPSVYEGFGSPQTEAMAAGLPMILSDIPTNREVSGELALYYPVGDPDLLAKAMELTLLGIHKADTAKYTARLSRFDWQQSAAEIRAAYEAHKK
ncbi:MAG: glycosyltransferase family 4 protein [Clostridia bacterium]|nr:glycosyltransferase family 4 protein [Clostridia bacterium]